MTQTPSSPATLEGLSGPADLGRFFSAFPLIVLVANSDAVDLDTIPGAGEDGVLHVFFNKVYKVLDAPFERRSILVARSSPAGANIVYRREVGEVTRLLEGPRFHGVLNIAAGEREVFSPAEAFGGRAVAHLNLTADLSGFYPSTHVPTSGFALALHLLQVAPNAKIVLAGFTARRSAEWKLFQDHDWTFEQIVLRLLHRSGKLTLIQSPGGVADGPLEAIAKRFPDLGPAAIATVAAEVLSERLDNANGAIDALIKTTRLERGLANLYARLRPASRKARLANAPAKPPSA